MYNKHQDNLDACPLYICNYCHTRIENEIEKDGVDYGSEASIASSQEGRPGKSSKKTKKNPTSPQEGDACDRHFPQNDQSLKCLVVMCIGLTDSENAPLIDFSKDPWTSIKSKKTKPQNHDLKDKVTHRWSTYFAAVAGDKT